MAELKPCPFCGADKPSIEIFMAYGSIYHEIVCDVCGASTNGFLDKEKAIKAWERRAVNGK